jgi:hypothetical protein
MELEKRLLHRSPETQTLIFETLDPLDESIRFLHEKFGATVFTWKEKTNARGDWVPMVVADGAFELIYEDEIEEDFIPTYRLRWQYEEIHPVELIKRTMGSGTLYCSVRHQYTVQSQFSSSKKRVKCEHMAAKMMFVSWA